MIYNDTTRVCYISHLIAWQRNIVSVCALPKKKVWVNEMSWQTVLAAINGHNSVVRSDEELSKRHGIHLKWIRSNELVTVFSAVFKQINEANWNWNGMESNDPLLLISTLQYSHLISFQFHTSANFLFPFSHILCFGSCCCCCYDDCRFEKWKFIHFSLSMNAIYPKNEPRQQQQQQM